MKKSEASSTMHNPDFCPVTMAINLIARKWSVSILFVLLQSNEPLRFNALQKAIGIISQRELTKHLREFETAGIVTRKVYPEVPPRVEYVLTDLGRSLCGPMTALSEWADKYGPEIEKRRKIAIEEK